MQDRVVSAFISSLKSHVLLLGPRQVGKSTLVKGLAPRLYINFAFEGDFLTYAKNPRRLQQEVDSLNSSTLIVIDEVQRLPSIFNTIQALIDNNRLSHRFILTGSSARKLRRGGANLLPGRIVQTFLDPLLIEELSEPLHLQRALQVGMLPGVYLNQSEGALLLGTYVDTYLKEEVRAEGLAQNIGSFSRLLDSVAIISGAWINYSKLSSDTEIPKETVRRYIDILEDTLVLHRLSGFAPRQKISRRVTQRDKIILFDVGVRNALLGLHEHQIPPTEMGHLFEQWFVLQIISFSKAYRLSWLFSSYLTKDGAEVDLVIEMADRIVGLEIKYGETLHLRSHAGLKSLGRYVDGYKPYTAIIAFTGNRALTLEDGTKVLPYQEVCEALRNL
jgi:uncharacterized protein